MIQRMKGFKTMFDCFKKEKQMEEPDRDTVRIDDPTIVRTGISIKTRGNYRGTKSGFPKGLIVHYTAGRNNPEGTLQSLAKRGLGCLVMDEKGTIYQAKNQDIDDVAYHAGKSKIHGKNGASFYCIGMEICNAGKLEVENTPNGVQFTSWFGQKFKHEQVREVFKKNGFSTSGFFHKYTHEQVTSLIAFCIWMKDVSSDFDFEWVMGHDEVAVPRGRKSDPSGSLDVSMPEFRRILKETYKNLK